MSYNQRDLAAYPAEGWKKMKMSQGVYSVLMRRSMGTQHPYIVWWKISRSGCSYLKFVRCFCRVVWCSLYEEPRQEFTTGVSTDNIILMLSQFVPSFLHLFGFCSCCTVCIVSISILYFITYLKSLGKIFIFLGSWFLYL